MNTLPIAASRWHQRMWGALLVRRLPGRSGWELRLVVQGGLRLLDKAQRLNTFKCRPVISRWDAPRMLWRAIRM